MIYQLSNPAEEPEILRARLEEKGCLVFPELGGLNILDFLANFGHFRLQEDGQIRYLVKAGQKLQPNDGGSLMPHTDDFNSEKLPPRIVALHCIRPDKEERGQTLLGDGLHWLKTLSPPEIKLIRGGWRYRKGEGWNRRPFLSESPDGQIILRVSFGHLDFAGSIAMRKLMSGLSSWFSEKSVPINHRKDSLLVWNNWRMIHGRNAYTDLRRELHRYHLD